MRWSRSAQCLVGAIDALETAQGGVVSRRSESLMDVLVRLPWPVALVVGLLGLLFIQYGVPAWLSGRSGAAASILAGIRPVLSMLGWFFLGACVFAATLSFWRGWRIRRLLETRRDLDDLAQVGWRDFERLVGEAFRQQGYDIEETGLGGADGGVDLVLWRDGRRTLVQCKQWRRERVPVNVVREMYGLLVHHQADAVCIAALGGFTPDAARFAEGKAINLLDGPKLLALMRSVQSDRTVRDGSTGQSPVNRFDGRSEAAVPAVPSCPKCGAGMIERANRRTGERFLGCARFPACRGTR